MYGFYVRRLTWLGTWINMVLYVFAIEVYSYMYFVSVSLIMYVLLLLSLLPLILDICFSVSYVKFLGLHI